MQRVNQRVLFSNNCLRQVQSIQGSYASAFCWREDWKKLIFSRSAISCGASAPGYFIASILTTLKEYFKRDDQYHPPPITPRKFSGIPMRSDKDYSVDRQAHLSSLLNTSHYFDYGYPKFSTSAGCTHLKREAVALLRHDDQSKISPGLFLNKQLILVIMPVNSRQPFPLAAQYLWRTPSS